MKKKYVFTQPAPSQVLSLTTIENVTADLHLLSHFYSGISEAILREMKIHANISNLVYCIWWSWCDLWHIRLTRHGLGNHFAEHLHSLQLLELSIADHFPSNFHANISVFGLIWCQSEVTQPGKNSISTSLTFQWHQNWIHQFKVLCTVLVSLL